jgi:hypothetical protein
VNTVPGEQQCCKYVSAIAWIKMFTPVFTALHFQRNLQMGPKSWCYVCYTWRERLAKDKYSSLQGQFKSYEDNELFPGTAFTTLHFLHNLEMGPIS